MLINHVSSDKLDYVESKVNGTIEETDVTKEQVHFNFFFHVNKSSMWNVSRL